MIGCSAVRAICTSIAQLRRSGISAGNPGLCLPSSPSQPNAHGAGPAECSPACSAHRSGVVYVWAVRTCSAHSSPSAPCAPSRLPGPLFLSGAVFLMPDCDARPASHLPLMVLIKPIRFWRIDLSLIARKPRTSSAPSRVPRNETIEPSDSSPSCGTDSFFPTVGRPSKK
jgi:hypothetical protein